MSETKKQPISPGKKGGAVYPRINLEDAAGFARKLVSKTHTGPQPHSTIIPGVFGVKANNTTGQVRASALKQFGLLQGKTEAYSATELAKKIAVAVPEEVHALYRSACLTPRIFRVLFDTFHGDTVSLARLKQQAASAGVHPDFSDNCAQLFAESASFARIGQFSGDTLKLTADAKEVNSEENLEPVESNELLISEENELSKKQQPEKSINAPPSLPQDEKQFPSARSVIQVNVTIDSSLDTEKLERQLAILRKYGAL